MFSFDQLQKFELGEKIKTTLVESKFQEDTLYFFKILDNYQNEPSANRNLENLLLEQKENTIKFRKPDISALKKVQPLLWFNLFLFLKNEKTNFLFQDKKKQKTQAIRYACVLKSAALLIEEILSNPILDAFFPLSGVIQNSSLQVNRRTILTELLIMIEGGFFNYKFLLDSKVEDIESKIINNLIKIKEDKSVSFLKKIYEERFNRLSLLWSIDKQQFVDALKKLYQNFLQEINLFNHSDSSLSTLPIPPSHSTYLVETIAPDGRLREKGVPQMYMFIDFIASLEKTSSLEPHIMITSNYMDESNWNFQTKASTSPSRRSLSYLNDVDLSYYLSKIQNAGNEPAVPIISLNNLNQEEIFLFLGSYHIINSRNSSLVEQSTKAKIHSYSEFFFKNLDPIAVWKYKNIMPGLWFYDGTQPNRKNIFEKITEEKRDILPSERTYQAIELKTMNTISFVTFISSVTPFISKDPDHGHSDLLAGYRLNIKLIPINNKSREFIWWKTTTFGKELDSFTKSDMAKGIWPKNPFYRQLWLDTIYSDPDVNHNEDLHSDNPLWLHLIFKGIAEHLYINDNDDTKDKERADSNTLLIVSLNKLKTFGNVPRNLVIYYLRKYLDFAVCIHQEAEGSFNYNLNQIRTNNDDSSSQINLDADFFIKEMKLDYFSMDQNKLLVNNIKKDTSDILLIRLFPTSDELWLLYRLFMRRYFKSDASFEDPTKDAFNLYQWFKSLKDPTKTSFLSQYQKPSPHISKTLDSAQISYSTTLPEFENLKENIGKEKTFSDFNTLIDLKVINYTNNNNTPTIRPSNPEISIPKKVWNRMRTNQKATLIGMLIENTKRSIVINYCNMLTQQYLQSNEQFGEMLKKENILKSNIPQSGPKEFWLHVSDNGKLESIFANLRESLLKMDYIEDLHKSALGNVKSVINTQNLTAEEPKNFITIIRYLTLKVILLSAFSFAQKKLYQYIWNLELQRYANLNNNLIPETWRISVFAPEQSTLFVPFNTELLQANVKNFDLLEQLVILIEIEALIIYYQTICQRFNRTVPDLIFSRQFVQAIVSDYSKKLTTQKQAFNKIANQINSKYLPKEKILYHQVNDNSNAVPVNFSSILLINELPEFSQLVKHQDDIKILTSPLLSLTDVMKLKGVSKSTEQTQQPVFTSPDKELTIQNLGPVDPQLLAVITDSGATDYNLSSV